VLKSGLTASVIVPSMLLVFSSVAFVKSVFFCFGIYLFTHNYCSLFPFLSGYFVFFITQLNFNHFYYMCVCLGIISFLSVDFVFSFIPDIILLLSSILRISCINPHLLSLFF